MIVLIISHFKKFCKIPWNFAEKGKFCSLTQFRGLQKTVGPNDMVLEAFSLCPLSRCAVSVYFAVLASVELEHSLSSTWSWMRSRNMVCSHLSVCCIVPFAVSYRSHLSGMWDCKEANDVKGSLGGIRWVAVK